MLDILKVDNGRRALLCTIYTFKQFHLSVNSQQCRHLLPLDNGRICFHFFSFFTKLITELYQVPHRPHGQGHRCGVLFSFMFALRAGTDGY